MADHHDHRHQHGTRHDHDHSHHDHAAGGENGPSAAEAVSTRFDGRLCVVGDPAALVDHGGKQAHPLSPSGLPYQWRMRYPEERRTFYGANADVLCAVLIGKYPNPNGDTSRGALLAALKARGRHATGVIMTIAAGAYLSGQLDEAQERWLQASTEHTPELPSLTREQLPRWDHPTIPLILIKELYDPDAGTYPPGGNISWIRCDNAEDFLQDLSNLGVIQLEQDDTFTQLPPTRIILRQPTEPDNSPDHPSDPADPADGGEEDHHV